MAQFVRLTRCESSATGLASAEEDEANRAKKRAKER